MKILSGPKSAKDFSILRKIVIGICSRRKNHSKRVAIRKTWLKDGNDSTYLFFVGNGDNAAEESLDLVKLDAGDSYDELPEKVIAFFNYALTHYDFDWLFKCDDDTYLAIPRLISIIDDNYDIIGYYTKERPHCPHGGPGYLLSRELVEKIVASNLVPKRGWEDDLIGHAAAKLGARKKAVNELLCRDHSYFPQKENNIVSAHELSPSKMKSVHAAMHNAPHRIFHGKHPHWIDRVIFHEDGTFYRKNSLCGGTWAEDAEKLLLKWYDWAPETLLKDGANYAGNGFMLIPIDSRAPMSICSPSEKVDVSAKCCLFTFSRKRLNFICGLINCMKTQSEDNFNHLIHLFDYTDDEIQFIESVVNGDTRFILRRLVDQGQKNNFRRILHDTGDDVPFYIKVDDDDIYAPQFLETLLHQAKDCDITCGQSLFTYDIRNKTYKVTLRNGLFGNNMCFSQRAKIFLITAKDDNRFAFEDGQAYHLLLESGFKENIFNLHFPQIMYVRHGTNTI